MLKNYHYSLEVECIKVLREISHIIQVCMRHVFCSELSSNYSIVFINCKVWQCVIFIFGHTLFNVTLLFYAYCIHQEMLFMLSRYEMMYIPIVIHQLLLYISLKGMHCGEIFVTIILVALANVHIFFIPLFLAPFHCCNQICRNIPCTVFK